MFDERRYGKGMRTPESGACRPLLGFFYILVRSHREHCQRSHQDYEKQNDV